jgi:hypothetical protein
MIRQNPILIAAPPRSGTTMLAGLLHKHGVWVGRARTTMYPGTNSDFGSENIDIKNVFQSAAKKAGYQNWTTPFPAFGSCRFLKKEIEEFVPQDRRWLVKTSWCLIYWHFWRQAYPKARWVFPTRDTLKIVDSMNRHPGMRWHPDGEKRQYIAHLLRNASEVIASGAHYHYVDIERLADRDPETINALFLFLRMKPDYKIIDEWIQPTMLNR